MSSALKHKPTHVEEALARLPSQFENAATIRAVIEILGNMVQELEDVLWSLIGDRYLDTAEGAQLDVIGRVVGIGRTGTAMSDRRFRRRIVAKIAANVSDGQHERLIEIIQAMNGGLRVSVTTVPHGAHVILDFRIPEAEGPHLHEFWRTTRHLLETGVAAGVRYTALGYTERVKPFGFLGHPDAAGFGEGRFVPIGAGF